MLQGIGQLVEDFAKKKAELVFINVQVSFVHSHCPLLSMFVCLIADHTECIDPVVLFILTGMLLSCVYMVS